MEGAERALPPSTERGSYKIWTYDKLRYNDTDRQGHVNNAIFATFFETGRVASPNCGGAERSLAGVRDSLIGLPVPR
jgi:acyl-CoA thioesterase FadM